MTQAFWVFHGIQGIHEPVHPPPHFLVILKQKSSMAPAQLFIEADSLPDVKGMGHRNTRLVKAAHHGHAFFHIVPIRCIRISGTFIVIRYLIPRLFVHVQHMLGDFKRGNGVVDCFFLFPVNQKFCSRTWYAADAVAVLHLKQKRLVGHARFQAADIFNVGFRYLEYLCDQLHGRIVRMILIAGVKQAQLLQVLKLIYLVIRLAVHIHLYLIPSGSSQSAGFLGRFQQSAGFLLQPPPGLSFQHINIDLFPVELLCSRRLIIGFQHGKELPGKFPGKISRTIHDPLVPSAYFHIGDPSLFIEIKAPLLGLSPLKSRAVPGPTFIGMIHVLPHPVVR